MHSSIGNSVTVADLDGANVGETRPSSSADTETHAATDGPAEEPVERAPSILEVFFDVHRTGKPVEGRRLYRVVFLVLLFCSGVAVAIGVAGGLYLRSFVLNASSKSDQVRFESLSFSVSDVISASLQSSVTILSLLAAGLSLNRAPNFQEFRRISGTIRANVPQAIIQWAPVVQHADRAAWEAYVQHELNTTNVMRDVSACLLFVTHQYLLLLYF